MMNSSARFLFLTILALDWTALLTQGFTVRSPHQKASTCLLCSKYDLEAALVKLPWEVMEGTNSRPVTNPSLRDTFPEDIILHADTSTWDQGQLWATTRQGLKDRGVRVTNDFLSLCPQLLRLSSQQVLETADWMLQEFGAEFIVKEPRLLLFRQHHVLYGLEFMRIMMMVPNVKSMCASLPDLLLSAIQGGIQEKAVKTALAVAGGATFKVSQRVAGDALSSFKQFKQHGQGTLK